MENNGPRFERAKGVALYPGDQLMIQPKGSVDLDLTGVTLNRKDLLITVTQVRKSDGEKLPYVRISFDCGKGIFVSTYKKEQIEPRQHFIMTEPPVISPEHKRIVLTRYKGQTIRFQPAISGREAAHDLRHNGIIIAPIIGKGEDNFATLAIYASPNWNVFREEVAEQRRDMEDEAGNKALDERLFQQAFVLAAKKVLPRDMYYKVMNAANELLEV